MSSHPAQTQSPPIENFLATVLVRTWGCQTCFLPKAPSDSVRPWIHQNVFQNFQSRLSRTLSL